MLLLTLANLAEGVAHDGDEHVQGCDLRKESREEEEHVAEQGLLSTANISDFPVAKRNQILVKKGVQLPVVEVADSDLVHVFFSSVHAQNVQ